MVFQALINMGVAVGVFPVTGQTLPLLSMGGSSIIFTSFAFGVILSVSNSIDNNEKSEDLSAIN
jgi:cell division protein FtsW